MQKKLTINVLAESAVLIALGTVLSLIKLADLPYGGSITMVSMLPLLLIAYRHGMPWGFACGAIYGAVQQLLGLKNLSYFTTPGSIVAIIVFDYLLAFAVIGIGGIGRRSKNQPVALCCGAFLAGLLRYICHVISGATVWAGISIPTKAALLYSFVYNATYMLPETIILCLAAYYVGQVLDFSKPIPERSKKVTAGPAAALRLGGVGLVVAALIYDVVAVFSVLQNGETGEFDIAALGTQKIYFYITMVVISVLAVAVALFLWLLANKKKASEGK